MKKSKVATFVSAIVLIGACLTASQANARDNIVVQVKFQGKGAAAFWWIPTDACRATFLQVYPSDDLQRSGTDKVMASGVGASLYRYNYCTQQSEIDAYGDVALSPDQFTAKESLTHASLTGAIIPMYDHVSGATFTLSVDLRWKGGDTTYGGTSTSYFKAPGRMYRTRYSGKFTNATARGSVMFGSENLAANPSDDGDIHRVTYGNTEVIKVAP